MGVQASDRGGFVADERDVAIVAGLPTAERVGERSGRERVVLPERALGRPAEVGQLLLPLEAADVVTERRLERDKPFLQVVNDDRLCGTDGESSRSKPIDEIGRRIEGERFPLHVDTALDLRANRPVHVPFIEREGHDLVRPAAGEGPPCDERRPLKRLVVAPKLAQFLPNQAQRCRNLLAGTLHRKEFIPSSTRPYALYNPAVSPVGRVLLMDVDGVLVTPPDWYGVRLRRESPELAAAFFDGPFLSATRGEIDLLDHLPPFLTATGRSHSPEAFLAEWHEYENHPDLAVWEAVRRLRAEGWTVYLATNQERHRLRHLLKEVGLAELVDGEVASCSVGHRKPSPAYFEEAARRLRLAPERIVFWDDARENVEAARAAGWTAYLYEGVEGFVRRMAA